MSLRDTPILLIAGERRITVFKLALITVTQCTIIGLACVAFVNIAMGVY